MDIYHFGHPALTSSFTSILKDDIENLDIYLFQIPRNDAKPYHTCNTNSRRMILKNDFKNIGNYLYLLFQNYFHSNPIYVVLGALKKA